MEARATSAVYVPLLLAAAGLLDPREGAQWREHRLTQAWWQPTVETLRLAEPVPTGPFLQMLAYTDAQHGEVPAVLAADGGERPEHLSFAPVVQAVAHSSTGYKQPLVQDLILEAFGGLVLARGVGARADELRSPAAWAAAAAAEPRPPLPPPQAPPRAEREALDGADLQAALRQRVATLRSAPAFLRGPLRNALRKALREIHAGEANEARQLRGWKLLFLIPRMLLSKDPGARTVPKEQLMERFARFEAGDWAPLLAFPSPKASRRRPRAAAGRSDEELSQCCARAHALAQQGEVSAARQALTASAIAPGTEATLAELRGPARRLAEPRGPLRADLAALALEPLFLESDELLRNLRGCRRGAAPGPSGLAGEHLHCGIGVNMGKTKTAWLLLSMCANPRANFYLRTMAREGALEFAVADDEHMAQARSRPSD
ncbi:unnamed protein product [Prorocentrum cordatum]|uniref:Uncharacterized protein n=1 Tax=Prorocentrum cordatum TaxID=2364126 RepID=A0ABN9TEB5_9DINO|nr:unnamed protein product [Polarella glacialis]